MVKDAYIIHVIDYEGNLILAKVVRTLREATDTARQWLFEDATFAVTHFDFEEEFVREKLAKAHEEFDNLEIKLDKNGYWSKQLGYTTDGKISILKTGMEE